MMQWEDTVIAERQLRKKKKLKERITITLRGGCVSVAQVFPLPFFLSSFLFLFFFLNIHYTLKSVWTSHSLK